MCIYIYIYIYICNTTSCLALGGRRDPLPAHDAGCAPACARVGKQARRRKPVPYMATHGMSAAVRCDVDFSSEARALRQMAWPQTHACLCQCQCLSGSVSVSVSVPVPVSVSVSVSVSGPVSVGAGAPSTRHETDIT